MPCRVILLYPLSRTSIGLSHVPCWDKNPEHQGMQQEEQGKTPIHGVALQVLRELPDHLAVSVLRASGATLHQCMLALPPQQHACAVEALCWELSSDKALHIAGRETAKIRECSDTDEKLCSPVDTVAVACSAAASFKCMQVCSRECTLHVYSIVLPWPRFVLWNCKCGFSILGLYACACRDTTVCVTQQPLSADNNMVSCRHDICMFFFRDV